MESVQHILPAAAPVGAALIQQFKTRFPGITVREGAHLDHVKSKSQYTS